ncbi:MAG: methyltransferase domain-containing protein [Verrucomicrobiae bacterium]|nr:methyltransferase domain-containing protein [Verrucomicrobiae bacterium]
MAKHDEDKSSKGQLIPAPHHFFPLQDAARLGVFKEAIEQTVPKDGKVVELGGGTGVLSFFAARRAAKVWCVERDPVLADMAEKLIAGNAVADRVEVVVADAMEYLPPEPVDAVICSMLDVGLLRKKQVAVVESFKRRYRQAFPGRELPVFIPEASILAAQPVRQSFDFCGYQAPVTLICDPAARNEGTTGLADPVVYQMAIYGQDLPSMLVGELEVRMATGGALNAVRFITKNAVAILVKEKRTLDWFNFYLVAPLARPMLVAAGEVVRIRFNYEPGAGISALTTTLKVSRKTA